MLGSSDRRDFLTGLMAMAAMPGIRPSTAAGIADVLRQNPQPLQTDADAAEFWSSFLRYKTPPAASVATAQAGLTARGGNSGLEREAFFFHYSPDGFQPAVEIPAGQLISDGDVSVSLNLSAFKPAVEDRDTFERLQTAQLRIDVLQDVSIIDLLDTLAWTAVAVLRPNLQKKLPPIQTLSFDPSTAWQKMQNIVLPKGQGRWAVNLYAQKSDGLFARIVEVLNKEVGRFAPVLGLPAVSMTALQSFNTFYGAFHDKPEYLFQSNPVPVYATAAAMKSSPTSRGIPVRSGTYVLVPVSQAGELTEATLAGLEMKQGVIVPKNTPAVRVYDAALELMPKVTYATLDVSVKPVQVPCAAAKTGRGGF
jgi:hypothetical protein